MFSLLEGVEVRRVHQAQVPEAFPHLYYLDLKRIHIRIKNLADCQINEQDQGD